VYIKPLQNSEEWLGGIAVPIENLLPIRSRKDDNLLQVKFD